MANINEYKRSHKPDGRESVRYRQGYYIPENRHKVVGGDIIYRSSWEYRLARWCDLNPDVVRWGCETVAVEYRDPAGVNLDECRRYGLDPNDPSQWPVKNYYIDFYIEYGGKGWDGNPDKVVKYLVEVKPKAQTRMPEPVPDTAPLKAKRKFNTDARTYLTNREKWKAASAFAERNNAVFEVWTEVTLKRLGVL